MTSKISMILEVLGDGKWHLLEEMRLQTGVTFEEMEEIVSFLCKYGFAAINTANGTLKINPAFKQILA